MNKLFSTIAVFLIAMGIFAPAYAYQSGFGLATMDLGSFDYAYEYANDGNGSDGVSFSKVDINSAGYGAFLGIYENNAGFSANGDWQGVMNRYDDAIEAFLVDDDTLYASLYLGAGDYFTIFAGTLAYANAKETQPVPEPATMILLGVGLIGIAGLGRMRSSKK